MNISILRKNRPSSERSPSDLFGKTVFCTKCQRTVDFISLLNIGEAGINEYEVVCHGETDKVEVNVRDRSKVVTTFQER